MKRIAIRWVMLFAISTVIIGCGEDGSNEGHNSPPVIDHLIVPEQVDPGESVELQVVAHDADGDVLSYVWEVKAGTLDSKTGRTVNWTAPSNVKSATVLVYVNDGINESVVKSKSVAINLENSAPIIKEIVVPTEVHAGARIQLQAVTEDVDGDTLTYNWSVEEGMLSSETTPTPTWTAPIELGSVTVALTVSDGISEAFESVTVKIIHSLIVAGEQAAGIKLGDAFDKVKALYGRPSDRDGNRFAYRDPDIGLSGYLDGIDLVSSLFIKEPNKAKTAGGNGIRSTRKRVEAEFGRAEEIKDGGKSHWYWKKGIKFTYDDDSRVTRIYIFKPHPAAPARLADALPRKQELQERAAFERKYRSME